MNRWTGCCTAIVMAVLLNAWVVRAQSLGRFALEPDHYFSANSALRRDLYRESLNLGREEHPVRDYDVDLAPLLDYVLGYVHAAGIPLRPAPELADAKGIAFSAAWRIAADMPAVNLHIGDSGPLDAFYANDGGFRWAFTWPVPGAPRVAFHIEGGEDGVFGNWALIGVQWRAGKRPLAVGIGVPMSMAESHGPFGIMCQMRWLLE